ncbi:MAG: S-adenosylmethionine:tRNA ribosyltransferase-isomerase, partial [Mariprofundaceae bacterium]
MRLADFDYDLPLDRIAKRPLAERDDARLLVLEEDGLADRVVRDLPALVRPGDVWVVNDTKVIPARLIGRKASGGRVEILLLEPTGAGGEWRAWGRSNKPLRPGQRIHIAAGFEAEVRARNGRELILRLIGDDPAALIERHGHMPLPPYIDRPDDAADRERYQTVFARQPGAVAAPTAG